MEMNQLVMKDYLGIQKVYEKFFTKIDRTELFILEQFDENGYPVIGSEDDDEVKEIYLKKIKYEKKFFFSYQKWMKTKRNLHLIFHPMRY